ncbi:hypothetical protein QTP70_020490 [Hemibagrus guttatus]|uniref:NACHT domain-containing protein n=1 Tax=Hemibagrus guttatus TaxID=175788 RepID=A0AAE0RK31_9TELE|nr:hypothetical protein QTP70_020490 [Hemibagrus guttatus]
MWCFFVISSLPLIPEQEVEIKMISMVKNELKRQIQLLSSGHPACSEKDVEDDYFVREMLVKITAHVLIELNQEDLSKALQKELLFIYQERHKSKIRDEYKRICETSQRGTPTRLNEIYTELYRTEDCSGDVNNEHEVRQIQTASRRSATQQKTIKCNDLFREIRGKPIRTVLTKGVAGIGKTVSVHKFILDWAEGKANQDVTFMFPLPFRELNLMKFKTLSLINLLHQFFPKASELESINCKAYKIVFIFDGLDECRLPLNYKNNKILCDVTEAASVDVLFTNLIKGNLLPSAHLWITSRPVAAHQLPSEHVDLVTDVRGFSDPQKEEYFRKRISDQNLANKIITHIKSSRSLSVMCQIPVFCWISATVLERMLSEAESQEIPKTLTQMFTHFLIFQIESKDQKQTRETILALGELAFQQLEKGNLIFYEEDLRECGIVVREASKYSEVCTQIFGEEFELHLGKVFSFIHLSVQEYLAALYAFLSFFNRNLIEQHTTYLFKNSNMSDFLKSAVDKALMSKTGHLDLFLRFLLGLSLESNQTLLRSLLPQTTSSSRGKDLTVRYIKEKIQENLSVEKSINLFHCLDELNDQHIVQEVQNSLRSGDYNRLRERQFTSIQWSALVFVLLNSTQEHDEFDLRTYHQTEECLIELLAVVKESRKAVLVHCGISDDGCVYLASAVKSNPESNLCELNLNRNEPGDQGVMMLSDLLKDTNCKLKILYIETDPYELDRSSNSYLSNKPSCPDLDLVHFAKSHKHGPHKYT